MKLIASLTAYLLAIVLANYLTDQYGLVSVGFGLMVTAGTFAAGFALVARDGVRETAGARWRWWIAAAIALGCGLSYFLASPQLALASAVAFGGAEVVDTVVYEWARRRGVVVGVLTSNAASAPVDTVLFLQLAGFPLTWSAVLGQFIAKYLWATLLPLAVAAVAFALRRRTVAT